jgi:hypothetical protein
MKKTLMELAKCGTYNASCQLHCKNNQSASWNWTLLEKLTVAQLRKNFPTVYGTRRFCILFTSALHWFLSWAITIKSKPLQRIFLWSILLLFSNQSSPWLFSSGFPHQTYIRILRVLTISPPWLHYFKNICWKVQVMKLQTGTESGLLFLLWAVCDFVHCSFTAKCPASFEDISRSKLQSMILCKFTSSQVNVTRPKIF